MPQGGGAVLILSIRDNANVYKRLTLDVRGGRVVNLLVHDRARCRCWAHCGHTPDSGEWEAEQGAAPAVAAASRSLQAWMAVAAARWCWWCFGCGRDSTPPLHRCATHIDVVSAPCGAAACMLLDGTLGSVNELHGVQDEQMRLLAKGIGFRGSLV